MIKYDTVNDKNILNEWKQLVDNIPFPRRWERVRQTSAYYLETKYNNNYILVLKSYSTIVAIYNKTKCKLIICGGYSQTTTKHINEFEQYVSNVVLEKHYLDKNLWR